MSEDIYAKPDKSKKVRYNRNVQKDKEEWEEREVEIYDAIGDDQTDNQSHGGGPDTERPPPAVQRKTFRAAVLYLAVLCFLMMTGIILLSVNFILLQTRYDQLSNNYSQLQRNVSDIPGNMSQLQEEVKQLKNRNEEISVNNSQLESSYQTLRKNNNQLQEEVKQLKNRIKEKCCPDGWTIFGSSCYFKSKEEKNWFGSRADCRQRGADLVVINDEEEKKFVTELSKDGESWIGLRKIYTGQRWEWKWVDGSPLTETFWAAGQPHYDGYYAACCNQQGKWTQRYYSNNKNWICEKKIL